MINSVATSLTTALTFKRTDVGVTNMLRVKCVTDDYKNVMLF